MKIETPRLIIRPFQEKDADALYRIKTDPRVILLKRDIEILELVLQPEESTLRIALFIQRSGGLAPGQRSVGGGAGGEQQCRCREERKTMDSCHMSVINCDKIRIILVYL